MICPNCGNDNPVHVLFCMRCGEELSHEVSEVRAAVQEEVVTEENIKLERRLRELLALAIFVLIAAWAARHYAHALPRFEYCAFTSGPEVQVQRVPALELPPVEVPVPEIQPPAPPAGQPDPTVIRRLKTEAGKKD